MHFTVSSDRQVVGSHVVRCPFSVAPSDYPYGLDLCISDGGGMVANIDYGQTNEQFRIVNKDDSWSASVGINSGRIFRFVIGGTLNVQEIEHIHNFSRSIEWIANSSRKRRNFILGLMLITELFKKKGAQQMHADGHGVPGANA